MINTGSAFIYFYPTGEKDNAFIIIGSDTEMATIEFFPFIDRIQRNYIKIDNTDIDELDDIQNQKAKEVYEKWLSNK